MNLFFDTGWDVTGRRSQGLGSCPRAQVRFRVHLYAFQLFYLFIYIYILNFLFGNWLPATETSSSAKDPTAASLNPPSRAGTALVLLFSRPHAHPRWGVREIRAWLRVPGQPRGWCCGRSRLGKPIPPASFHIPLPRQHGQGPCAISQLPSSPSPPLAPKAAPPRCQVSTLLPRTVAPSTQQIKGGKNTPQTLQQIIRGGEEGGRRDHKAACNAMSWVTVAKPFLQQTAMQHKQPSPTPCRGCRVNS